MRQQANISLRQHAKNKGIYWWQVAEKIGVAESTIIRWLRTPLSKKTEEEIMSAIAELEVQDNG